MTPRQSALYSRSRLGCIPAGHHVRTMPAQARGYKNWCFTVNNPAEELLFDANYVQFAVYQLEVGATTGTPHYQGYVQFKTRMRLNAVRRLSFFPGGTHFESAKGTAEQNIAYCTKVSDGKNGGRLSDAPEPIIFGVQSQTYSGKRDLKSAIAYLQSDAPACDFAEHFPGIYRAYPDIVSRIKCAGAGRSADVDPVVIVCFGKAGTIDASSFGDLYPDMFYKQRGKWWDGYAGEKTVMYAGYDGYGNTPSEFRRITDRYPLEVEVRQSSLPLLATVHVFTCTKPPHKWWSTAPIGSEQFAGVSSRITEIRWYAAADDVRIFDNYDSFYDACFSRKRSCQ